ncbi:MAG: lipoxygenase [Anaerolineae bacterium]|nr:lipoxygenase [Gloeobacterales cyanobacterium ES-bin-313]
MPLPCLPQKELEANQSMRQDWLDRNSDHYHFDHNYLPGMPLLLTTDQGLPFYENFSVKYITERLAETADLSINMLAVPFTSFWDPFDEVKDYERFFPILHRPGIIQTFQTDAAFAEQRLCGVNPVVLKKVEKLEDYFPNTPDLFKKLQTEGKLPSNHNLDQMLKDEVLFVCDYRVLKAVKGGNYDKGRKFLPKPVALFAWISSGFSDRGQLVPIAIHDPEIDRLYTPFNCDANTWLYAKLCVQIADGNHHEMITHLCRTHFVMEPFAIATGQHLAENHPLGILLRQHLRFMLFNNQLGRQRLINREGPVDHLLAGTLPESLQLVVDGYESWNIQEFAFPTDIQNRGVDDVNKLPHYPFRDDGQLLWEAIHKYVKEYLSIYYQIDNDLSLDFELQDWATKLTSPGGGKMKGMPSTFTSLADLPALIELVCTVIFICGPLHSAVNYAQYEFMAFVPNMPLAAYSNVGQDAEKKTISQAELMQILPPPKRASEQLSSIYILSAYRYDRLGYYDDIFQDPQAREVAERFRQELTVIENRIDERNARRLIPYPYLKPSLVLNSISI